MSHIDRRALLGGLAAVAAAPLTTLGAGRSGLPGVAEGAARQRQDPLFRISLAEWSLHRELNDGRLDHLDFATLARREFDLGAVEYVNTFFFDRARDRAYLTEMKSRADDAGVRSLLIMCDREGRLGDPDPTARTDAIDNHRKWLEAAAFLGCHSIRVNAASEGDYEEQQRLAADGLHRLAQIADGHDVDVLVENHGGLSSDGAWLAEVVRRADHPRLGTLPDFGNFRIDDDRRYDNYRGVRELMPFARAVSAKSHDFDEDGREANVDYYRMMRIVLEAGYRGWVGIEYEGSRLDERQGVRHTQRLLERVREALTPEYAAD